MAQQAVDLKNAVDTLMERYGNLYPYIRIFPLQGVEQLNHRLYPDLYYAATSTAAHQGVLGVTGRYQMTDVQTTVSKAHIEELADRRMHIRAGIDQKTRENLRKLGIEVPERRMRNMNDDEDEPQPRRRRQ